MANPLPVRERTRREIREQALRLFAANGYEATSLQDIASAVGCSKAAVLYHFDGKAAILTDVLEPAAAALSALVEKLETLEPATAQLEAINGLIELSVRFRGLIPVLTDAPENVKLQGIVTAAVRIPEFLAGDDDPHGVALALFALDGLLAQCRNRDDYTDDALRDLLEVAMTRLLRPRA